MVDAIGMAVCQDANYPLHRDSSSDWRHLLTPHPILDRLQKWQQSLDHSFTTSFSLADVPPGFWHRPGSDRVTPTPTTSAESPRGSSPCQAKLRGSFPTLAKYGSWFLLRPEGCRCSSTMWLRQAFHQFDLVDAGSRRSPVNPESASLNSRAHQDRFDVCCRMRQDVLSSTFAPGPRATDQRHGQIFPAASHRRRPCHLRPILNERMVDPYQR